MSLRASFTSPNILLMTVFSQGIGSLNPFQNLKPSLLQGLAFILQLLMPLTGSEDLENMLKLACTQCGSSLLQQLWLG